MAVVGRASVGDVSVAFHLIVLRSVLVVTFGWAGSPPEKWSCPLSPETQVRQSYSSANPKARWPISCRAISAELGAVENLATRPSLEPPYSVVLTITMMMCASGTRATARSWAMSSLQVSSRREPPSPQKVESK